METPVSDAAAVQLAVIDRVARDAGVQVRIWDSLTENGSYQTGSNIVNVALDAEEGMLTRTTSHELFHFISEWSREQREKLRDFVMDALQKQYQNAQGKALTEDQAKEEIAAEGVLDVIGTEENLKALYKDKTLTEKIADWLKNTVAKLKEAMQRIAWNHPEVRALTGNVEYFEAVRQKFEEALKQAGENYRAALRNLYETAAADPDVKAYVEAIRKKVTAEDAKTEADALISKLFLRAEQGWIEQHDDQYEELV